MRWLALISCSSLADDTQQETTCGLQQLQVFVLCEIDSSCLTNCASNALFSTITIPPPLAGA